MTIKIHKGEAETASSFSTNRVSKDRSESTDYQIELEPNDLLSLALRALCLTRDYVGADVLPAVKGWEWYDAGNALAAAIPTDLWASEFQSRTKEQGTRGLPDMQTWQPIETAPKDGTIFRSYSPEFVHEDFNPDGCLETFWQDGEGFVGAVWNAEFDGWDAKSIKPTHWRRDAPPITQDTATASAQTQDVPDHGQASLPESSSPPDAGVVNETKPVESLWPANLTICPYCKDDMAVVRTHGYDHVFNHVLCPHNFSFPESESSISSTLAEKIWEYGESRRWGQGRAMISRGDIAEIIATELEAIQLNDLSGR